MLWLQSVPLVGRVDSVVRRQRMRSQQSIIRSNRICGSFFLFLGALSAVLSCFAFRSGDWWLAVMLLFGVCFCGFVGWIAVTSSVPLTQTGGSSGGRGFSD